MAPVTDPVAKHRREVWLYIVLPVVGVGAVILLGLIGLFTLAVAGVWTAQQIETVASVLMIICVLTPLVLLMLVFNMVAVAIAVGAGKAPAFMRPLLENARLLTVRMMTVTESLMNSSSSPFIAITARWTRWEDFVRGVFRSSAPTATENPASAEERQQSNEQSK